MNNPSSNGKRDPSDGPTVSLSIGITPDGLRVVGLMIQSPLIDEGLRPYVGLMVEEADMLALALIRAADCVRRSMVAGEFVDELVEGLEGILGPSDKQEREEEEEEEEG